MRSISATSPTTSNRLTYQIILQRYLNIAYISRCSVDTIPCQRLRTTAANMPTPEDAPPSYEKATGLAPPATDDIPMSDRRSMEDERRALPKGWVRQYDDQHHHQFFVDTTKDPPRSIWHHPYDDEDYLSSLTPKEREQIRLEHKSVSMKPEDADLSEEDRAGPSSRPHAVHGTSAASSSTEPTGASKLGRKLKDKLTSSTHEEREAQRLKRQQEERQAYEAHLRFRQAMSRAIQTGQPQHVGKDREGRDVYIEPPRGPGAGYYGPNQYGVNPYSSGVYANPNARFVRPDCKQSHCPSLRFAPDSNRLADGYGRPYGYGYGGGLGLPIAGGLLGGALLGGLLF